MNASNDRYPLRLFLDFDGTVTDRDVGDFIFETFIPPELKNNGWHRKLIDEWKAGRLSSQECLTIEAKQAIIDKKELDCSLDKFELTKGFPETVAYCRDHNISIMILSDGLDYYIRHILGRHGFGDIEYRANEITLVNGGMEVRFPYMDTGCGRCGNCKRSHIIRHRKDAEKTIYAGDGYSDRYAIRDVDVVFARRDLEEYCTRENITYTPFEDFFPILEYLREHHHD